MMGWIEVIRRYRWGSRVVESRAEGALFAAVAMEQRSCSTRGCGRAARVQRSSETCSHHEAITRHPTCTRSWRDSTSHPTCGQCGMSSHLKIASIESTCISVDHLIASKYKVIQTKRSLNLSMIEDHNRSCDLFLSMGHPTPGIKFFPVPSSRYTTWRIQVTKSNRSQNPNRSW